MSSQGTGISTNQLIAAGVGFGLPIVEKGAEFLLGRVDLLNKLGVPRPADVDWSLGAITGLAGAVVGAGIGWAQDEDILPDTDAMKTSLVFGGLDVAIATAAAEGMPITANLAKLGIFIMPIIGEAIKKRWENATDFVNGVMVTTPVLLAINNFQLRTTEANLMYTAGEAALLGLAWHLVSNGLRTWTEHEEISNIEAANIGWEIESLLHTLQFFDETTLKAVCVAKEDSNFSERLAKVQHKASNRAGMLSTFDEMLRLFNANVGVANPRLVPDGDPDLEFYEEIGALVKNKIRKFGDKKFGKINFPGRDADEETKLKVVWAIMTELEEELPQHRKSKPSGNFPPSLQVKRFTPIRKPVPEKRVVGDSQSTATTSAAPKPEE